MVVNTYDRYFVRVSHILRLDKITTKYDKRVKYLQHCARLLCDNQFIIRSSHPEVFCKKAVLRNFAKFTGKHLCQSLFFNKVAGLSLQLY